MEHRVPTPNAERPAVILVGGGERAGVWLQLLRQSPRFELVATVSRDVALASDVPHYTSLEPAMRSHAHASCAVALPPRSALTAALQLAAAGAAAVVAAPLHAAVAEAVLPIGKTQVRVAHGWVTLAGLRVLKKLMSAVAGGQIHVEIDGLPEGTDGEVQECLAQALALAHALVPQCRVNTATQDNQGTVFVELASPNRDWTVHLGVRAHGARLAVRLEQGAQAAVWRWQDEHEDVMLGDHAVVRRHRAPSAAVRALAQLLPDTVRGDDLGDAQSVMRLMRQCGDLLPALNALGDRPLRQASSIASRRPADVLAQLGLQGELPSLPPARVPLLHVDLPRQPFELWAFRAGIKPVAFLTVRPAEVDATLAHFGDVAVERRERLVHVGRQDRWDDRRDQGEPYVELYIARQRELAQRAAHLQAEADPSAAMRELGALVGYPACCVAAFAAQDDRANNSRNRYFSFARTIAALKHEPALSDQLGAGQASPLPTSPWPWELNNLHTMIVPFYPCTYRCVAALRWARAVLHEMGKVYPVAVQQLHVHLARPLLYFDHQHQMSFAGEATAQGDIAYRSVALLHHGPQMWDALATTVARGNRLRFDDRTLLVWRDSAVVLELERTDPGLGFVAPFGSD